DFSFSQSESISPSAKMMQKRRTLALKPSSRHDFALDHEEYDDISCQKCGSGDSPAELLLCDKCDRGYHLFCLMPILVSVPKGSWFCPTCSNHKKLQSFPLVQTKIVDFFRIQRPVDSQMDLNQGRKVLPLEI
ncbi:Histone-lysine N-methyltransferase ATXR6, partial [Cucurbita argyrosperma subsp. argyrosperma]